MIDTRQKLNTGMTSMPWNTAPKMPPPWPPPPLFNENTIAVDCISASATVM